MTSGGATEQGRPPWYDNNGQNRPVYIVGIAGGSASGKTCVAERIVKHLGVRWVVILSMDSFYRPLTPEQSKQAFANNYDFDRPDAFDYDALFETLLKLKKGEAVDVPVYDFSKHARSTDQVQAVYGATVVAFEGIFALYDAKVRELMDLCVFVDTDSDLRLARRLIRDCTQRGRDPEGVIQQYKRFVKPNHDQFIQPTMAHADIIIPRGLDNTIAIDVVTQHIRRQLAERHCDNRSILASEQIAPGTPLPPNVVVLEQTPQLLAIHTKIREASCSRDDFIFYADRLSRLVIERGLSELPYEDITVTTPVDVEYKGSRLATTPSVVTVVRSGAPMEIAARQVLADVPLGKVLIQSSPVTGEPRFHYKKLPRKISESPVLLLDATLGTGAAAMMAIRVLLDHGVGEDRIIFMCLLATQLGIHTIKRAFPKVKIVTSAVDAGLTSGTLMIEPGMGPFASRYFGTAD
ncbi:uridine kinase [Ramicandelaber brevisporus]|nr:uridine kinase [Ramicandelaber brevisporus]